MKLQRSLRAGVKALAALLGVLVLSACPSTTAPNAADDSPPTVIFDFYDFSVQGGEATPENPRSYRFPPAALTGEPDHRYGVVAKLADPESGVQFFEVTEGKGLAGCWVPGSTTQRSRLLSPRTPAGSSMNGSRQAPASGPLPTERMVSLTVDTFIDEDCPVGEELRWGVTLVFGGVNGAGQPPRDVTVLGSGYWDAQTCITMVYPPNGSNRRNC